MEEADPEEQEEYKAVYEPQFEAEEQLEYDEDGGEYYKV